MKTIKIWFTDFWPEWNIEDFITPILKREYEVILDKNKPDVLFHSIFNRMSETPKYNCKKVLILAENWRTSRFGSDYSISFDPHTEKNYRLPLWQMYLLLWPHLKDSLYNRVRHEDFKRFCSFTVSNPSNTYRNSMYDKLSSYKKVHSYGKVRMNSMGLVKASQGKYWRDAKFEYFNNHTHRFSIVYENSSYPGYCTEKLMDAFLVGSIPVYWGDPTVNKEWNSDAFINVHEWGDETLKRIVAMDEDKDMFDEIYRQPVFTEEQKGKLEKNLKGFEEWLYVKIKTL